MFEHFRQPLITVRRFLRRLALSTLAGLAIIAISLFIGMCGYHFFENMSWIDSFANAAMILSGMGPLTELKTNSGKLFAGLYALYSGLALITIAAVIFAPIIHRFLHRFHIDEAKKS